MDLAKFQELVARAVEDRADLLADPALNPEYKPLAALIDNLLRENQALRHDHRIAVNYIRDKINQMLEVIGTSPLKPEELDEKNLIGLDPLGIISQSFTQILEHSNLINRNLRLARDETRAIFASVGGGLLVMDNGRNILAANNHFREMFSPGADEIVGKRCYEIICGNENQPRESCCFKRMMASGRLASLPDWRFGDKHFSIVATPIRDSLGDIVKCVVLYIDITELIQIRLALDEERERLSTTLESIADGVIAIDNRGSITLMNNAAAEITGWSRAEAVDQPICSVFKVADQGDSRYHGDLLDEIIANNKSKVERLDNTLLLNRQGKWRDIYLSAAPIHQYDRSHAGTIFVFRDITREKRLDEELAKANRLDSLGIFAGGIAHDFNNLLTGILGNVSLARLKTDPDEKNRLLNETEKSTFRAKGLTQQLLTFAKGGMPVKKSVLIGELIKESVEFTLRGSGVSCDLKIADDLLPVEADEDQISQVIQNLVLNSRQAMSDQGGVIELTAGNVEIAADQEPLLAPGRYVKISITDRGAGIPKKIIDQIFDPFFTTKESGSGLGLATSYSIIRKHHGNITVESKRGKGTTFYLYLPAAREKPAAAPKTGTGVTGGSGRILIMDDEELVRKVTGSMLEHSGYDVELADAGAEAIEKYRKAAREGRPFAVVLMDLTIPNGMGGKEAVAALLAIDPAARVIAASGYSNDPVMADYRSYGFRQVIAKPYKIGELNEVVAEVIGAED
ncbi:MAG: PAS domain S-box protein [Desulfurivibrionaceae bacterium]|nr:PAS domain S-box protein [Desulfurivibrionaceae bacterium]